MQCQSESNDSHHDLLKKQLQARDSELQQSLRQADTRRRAALLLQEHLARYLLK